MFCMRCGNELPDNAGFCNKCGAQMGQMPQMQQMGAMQQPYPYAPYRKKNNTGLAATAIIFAVLSVPLLVLGFMRYSEGGYLYTWRPPYSGFELITIGMLVGGGLALLLSIILGIAILIRKSS